MTNKLIVIMKSLKVPKIKKNFTILNEISCTNLQLPPEPLPKGLPPPDPRSLCPQLNLLTPPRTKFLGTPLHPCSPELKNECNCIVCLPGPGQTHYFILCVTRHRDTKFSKERKKERKILMNVQKALPRTM